MEYEGENEPRAGKPNNKKKKQSNYYVIVYFRKQDEKSKAYLINRLAERRLGSDIIHCEIYFPIDKVSCSVDSSQPVYFFTSSGYNHDVWEGIRLDVTKMQYDTIFNFCADEQGAPFDSSGIILFDLTLCCTRDGEKQSWICSRLIACSLIRAGVLPSNIDPCRISPPNLRQILLSNEIDIDAKVTVIR